MKMKRSGPVRAACVALALLTLSGCSYFYPTPPVAPFEPLDHQRLRRFDQVAEGVYRGSQPTAQDVQSLIDLYRIQTIIKLNYGSDPAPSRGKVTVKYHPLNAWVTPSKKEIERILDDIDQAKKPVYIHCSFGEDRTGLIVAIYKHRHKVSTEDAYKDMVAHGFHPYHGVWSAWVREVGWKPTA